MPDRQTLRQLLAEESLALVFEAGLWLMEQPLASMVDVSACAQALRLGLQSERLVPALRKAIGQELRAELQRWRGSDRPLAEEAPSAAIEKIRSSLADPAWLQGQWLQKLAANEVLEQVMGATLYEVLREFMITVNPFFSSWGLPALLKKAGPLGKLGLMGMETGGRLAEMLREEFERQLEPHMKAFLQKSASAALARAVQLAQSEQNLEALARLRVRLFDQMLGRKRSELATLVDTDKLDALEELTAALAEATRGFLLHENLERRLRETLELHGSRTLGESLDGLGIDREACIELVGKALEPAVRGALTSDNLLGRLERIFDGRA